jgi:TatD DNase family protein
MNEKQESGVPMSGLVDTHAHLSDTSFDGDLVAVLARARGAGVSSIVAVGETLEDGKKNLALAGKYPQVLPAAGLYPTHLDVSAAQEMVRFIEREQDRLVAIGEVGLDFWAVKDEPEKEVQRDIFILFIALGKKLGLPLNVHSRSAGRHVVRLLLEMDAAKVQLHAFDGKASTAFPAVEAGYFFSIPPSILRSRQKQKLVKQLPLSSLLLETDSPVLGPAPGERNEPANAVLSLGAIAEIKDVSREEIMEAVTENTRRLYGHPQPGSTENDKCQSPNVK